MALEHELDIDTDIDLVDSDEDVAVIDRDDVSNYNPDNILPEPPEVIAEIRQWLNPTAYNLESGEYRKHLASHLEGTGQWFLEKPDYSKWHDSQDDGLLWIKGIPGSGKSVFAAALAHEFAKEGHPVLFFFFRQIIDANHKPINLLRDWLDQILEYSPPLQVQLKAYVDEDSDVQRSIAELNIRDLFDHLKTALAHMPRVYLVADALDEMDKGNDDFLQALGELGSWRPATAKVLITSRPVCTVEEPLRKIRALHVRLEESLVDMDIATFVQRGMDASDIPVEDRLLIKKAVPGRANGLFLYAKLAMDAFLETHADVRQVLQNLPADLNAMYTGLLREHSRRSGVPDDIQLLILSWVTHATRPLRLLELADFIKTTYHVSADMDLRAAKGLARAACGPLLEIQPDETVSVVHHSLTEFLTGSTRPEPTELHGKDNQTDHFPILIPGPTHERLALCCLQYLMTGCLDGQQIEKTRDDRSWAISSDKEAEKRYKGRRLEFPSLRYAAKNWPVHVLKSSTAGHEMSQVTAPMLDRFLSVEPRVDVWLDMEWRPRATEGVSPCHIAATYGLTDYLKHVLAHTNDKSLIHAVDCSKMTPLFMAAKHGHAAVVELLVAAGADPDIDDRRGFKPLHEAARNNHAAVVRVLLEAGVDPLTPKTRENPGRRCGNAPTSEGHTPLMYACSQGHLEALEAFLPYLKDVGTVHRALDWASRNSRSKLVKRLIQQPGVKINDKVRGNTPLFNACCCADIESMEALILAGADPTIPCVGSGYEFSSHSIGYRAGSLARQIYCLKAFCSSRKISDHYHHNESSNLGPGELTHGLNLLLRAGASMDQCSPHDAAGDPAMLRLLLQLGADPNAEADQGNTLLHTRFQGEDGWEMMKLLVEEGGADINKRRKRDGKTPLLAYLDGNDCDTQNILRFIGEFRPDCTLVDNEGANPVILAVKKAWRFGRDGTDEILEKLVTAGALVNHQDNCGRAAVHYADKTDTVKLLVKLGADINIRDHAGLTRLNIGLGNYRTEDKPAEEIDPLLELGARLDTRDHHGRTALHEAVRKQESTKVLDYLVGLGMDPCTVDFSGNTLLHEFVDSLKDHYSRLHENGCLAKFRRLVDLGISPKATNYAGRTIAHQICEVEPGHRHNGHYGMVIKHQALQLCDFEAEDNLGVRPIHLAASRSEASVSYLMGAGVDLFPRTHKRQSPLHIAAWAEQTNILGMLLQGMQARKLADAPSIVDASDDWGNTALFYACRSGRPESVALLLRAGAKLDVAQSVSLLEALLGFEDDNPPDAESMLTCGGKRKGRPARPLYEGIPRNEKVEHHSVRLEEIIELLVSHSFTLPGSNPRFDLGRFIKRANTRGFDYTSTCLKKLLQLLTNEEPVTESTPVSVSRHLAQRWAELRQEAGLTAFKNIDSVRRVAGKAVEQMDLLNFLLATRQFGAVEDALCTDGFDPLLPDADNNSPLHALVRFGYARLLAKIATEDHARKLDDISWRFEGSESSPTFRLGVRPLVLAACDRELPNMEVLRFVVEKLNASLNARLLQSKWLSTSSYGYETVNAALHCLAKATHWWQAHEALPFLLSRTPKPDLDICDKSGNTPLFIALESASISGAFPKHAARLLVEAGANVNAAGSRRRTCIGLAVETGDSEIVRLLLAHGCIITADALFSVIESQDQDMLDLLLSSGADPNMRRMELDPHEVYMYPLTEAATKPSTGRKELGNHEMLQSKMAAIVRLLLAHGADPFAVYSGDIRKRSRSDAVDDGDGLQHQQFTVLHEIVKQKDATIEPFLELLPNLDLEHQNMYGETVLLAVCGNTESSCRMVRVKNVDNRMEERMLVEVLLEHGASASARDKLGRNALHLTMLSLCGNRWLKRNVLPHEPIRLLLAHGSVDLLSERAKDTSHEVSYERCPSLGTEMTVLHCALHAVVAHRLTAVPVKDSGDETGSEENQKSNGDDSEVLIKLLLEAGSDPLAVDGEGNTALHILAKEMEWRPACRRLFTRFIQLGIDINAPNQAGRTPLFLFVGGGIPKVEWADPSWPDTWGEERDEEAAWRLFLDNGADFGAKDRLGRGLLHVAALNEYGSGVVGLERFKRLMSQEIGLDPMEHDEKMMTSLDVAAACGHEGILALFEGDEHGMGKDKIQRA